MMWKWFSWLQQVRRQELTAFIWFVPLVGVGWLIWKAGYELLAVLVVVAGAGAGIWLQWALFTSRLSPNAARSTMDVSDPVYDIPLQDPAVPSNPASDPLYNTDSDFTQASPEPETEPDLGAAPPDEAGKPPADA